MWLIQSLQWGDWDSSGLAMLAASPPMPLAVLLPLAFFLPPYGLCGFFLSLFLPF